MAVVGGRTVSALCSRPVDVWIGDDRALAGQYGVLGGMDLDASALLLTLYGAGTCLGIVSTFILLRTQLGATAKRWSLLLTRVGLVAGLATTLLIPGGLETATWYQDEVAALFAIVLPCLCFLHFAYLARRALFR